MVESPDRVSFFCILFILLDDLQNNMHKSCAICKIQDQCYLFLLNNAQIAHKMKLRVRVMENLDVNQGSQCKF